MAKLCKACMDGEHPNYDNDVRFCVVSEPGEQLGRAMYLCGEHRQAALDDGYTIKEKEM